MTNDTHIVKMLYLFHHDSPCGHSYSEVNTFFSSLGKLLSKQQKWKWIKTLILLTCTHTFSSLWWKKGVILSNYNGLNSHITIYCY